MKHSGKAFQAGLKIVFFSLIGLIGIAALGAVAVMLGSLVVTLASALISIWILFAIFTLCFFRDPTPRVPQDPNIIVSPAFGKVDVIDEIDDPLPGGGRSRRISVFLSVFDVHVQYAPVAGKLVYLQHTDGKFINAMKADECSANENVLLAFETTEPAREKLGIRLIAGLIARRIVPWVQKEDVVIKGERISLVQFGSRCDIYLPLTTQVMVKLGDKVRGGETVLAHWK
jgi:phosphatidylserine decarboxylase